MARKRKKSPNKRQIAIDNQNTRAARKLAMENLENIDKPRKKPRASFEYFPGVAGDSGAECPRCFKAFEEGERVRYTEDNILVHVYHKKVEIIFDICSKCFLAKPCECEE